MKLRSKLLWLGLGLTVAVFGLAAMIPQTQWRLHLLGLYFGGQISDIELDELVEFMLPGSDQSLAFLIDTRNPYASIKNARNSPDDIDAGGKLFRDICASCHGPDGSGGPVAPALVGRPFKHGDSDWAVYRTIRFGVPGTVMQPTVPLTTAQRWQVISYLRFIDIPDRSQDSAAARPEPRPVPAHELAGVRAPGADWLTYSGELRSSRHSELSQINRDSVGALATRWVHQFAGQPVLEVSPLVRDGVMFVSVPPCSVQALDARDGELLWSWSCTLLNDSASEIGGTVNRGVALLEDKVFVATWDARLVALSAATGKEIWRTTVDPDPKTYYISAAPLAFGDVVVTGVATREVGRAFVAAYDAATGAERWRFLAIPGPGERGNDTWSGDSWKTGGAPTWLTGSYDADLDLLYWGVGNPKPDYDTAGRSGDNLYTNSVVALRGKTGELVWHFQFTPADDKDWDANQIPIIADHRMSDGTVQKLLLWANRNGFYYTFDRESGKLLTAVPFVQQNWASGLDPNGRPIKTERADHGAQGELLFPGNVGGTSWWSPTYDAAAELMIVPVLEQGMVYFSSLQSPPRGSGKAFYTAVRALDASTGRRVWEYKRTPRFVDNHIGGLTSTAGGLVFGGDQSTFFALDAASGAELWSVRTGGSIVAAPVTYSVDGEQQVAIAAGGDLFAFALPRRPSAQPTVVADR